MTDQGSQSGGGDKPKRRRRRRRRKPGEAGAAGPGPDAGAAEAGAGAREGGGGRRRRKSRAPEGGSQGRPERAPRPRPRPERVPAPPPAAAVDVDAGWDDVDPGEARAPSVDESIRYGDDGDAPTPEVALAADLPIEDPAELDPSTAGEPGDETDGRTVRNVVGVKFQSAGKIYLYDGGDDSYRRGEEVMVPSDRGPRIGIVATDSLRRPQDRGQLKKILRRPDANDRKAMERNEGRERAALLRAREVVRALDLPLKVFRAELSHSGKKARIYFTSEDRVDFRDLVRELSSALHMRIEMRQTGVRDQAKLVGGIGSCGQELCCTTWLPEFVPVSIKNAKDQGLVLNPTKVSGQCGRLKCCLVYEQSLYAELRKGLPKLGKRVVTEIGEGRVVEVDVLRQRVRVSHVTGDVEVFTADQVQPLFPSQKPSPRKKRPEP